MNTAGNRQIFKLCATDLFSIKRVISKEWLRQLNTGETGMEADTRKTILDISAWLKLTEFDYTSQVYSTFS